MEFKKSSIIEGEFIFLREIIIEDAETIFSWRTGPSGQFMNQPDGYDMEMQINWMNSRPETEINYMIINKKNNEKVGMVAMVGISEQDKNAEIGRLLLAPEFLKKSNPFGLEALKICSIEILNVWGFHKIYGNVLSENIPMLKLQKYLGMIEEGLLKNQKSIRGIMYDLHLVALFPDALKQKYIPRINLLLKAFAN